MGGLQISCPLCCHKSFNSKQSLLEHLVNAVDNLNCPLCTSKFTSLQEIIEHLSQRDCQITHSNSVQNIVIYEQNDDNNENADKIKTLSDDLNTPFISDQSFEGQDDSKMYEFILKPQELKLIKDDGNNRYVILNQDEGQISGIGTILTRQNNDGTVSLTCTKDIKEESETLIVPERDLSSSQEIYSCNACKVSFTSVYEHIQNYHNDQEVVLEDIPTEIEPETSPTLDSDYQEGEESSTDKQTPRRVITDTGDIVEEPVHCKAEDIDSHQDCKVEMNIEPKQVLDKQGSALKRRLVLLNKGDKTAKQAVAKPETGRTDPYHKVITKEVPTEDGGTVTMYHCLLCNVNVSKLKEFESHPCKIMKYPCSSCPAAYENPKSLCAHMKVHKGNPLDNIIIADLPSTFECEVCNTTFPTNKSLKLHRRMHYPIKVRQIEPPVSSNGGSEITGAVYHCRICSKMIPFEYRNIHDNSHKTGDKINCSICNKKFTSKEYLGMHMNVHNVDKVPINNQDKSLPYECLYCNRRFARPHEKVKHERIHTGEKPHSCEICGKSFRVSYCLTLHMRTHTGARPYACQHCGKRFKAHSVYNHHLLTHSEVRAYKCPYCPKAFKTSVQLAGHKNSHTKPFSCQQCNRPFASLYAVRVHTETHSRQNSLKFSCALCGASYARAFALRDHVKQVHKQDMDGEEILNDNNQKDDWVVAVKENTTDTEDMTSLNKELQEEMTDLEMNAELIIP